MQPGGSGQRKSARIDSGVEVATAVEHEDALDAARRASRRRLLRAATVTLLSPVTVIAEVPLSWILIDTWQLNALMLGAAGLSLGLWSHWWMARRTIRVLTRGGAAESTRPEPRSPEA
ncbi:MAG: hypothetical protein OEN56_04270 [Gemmatimonadota bacterium]|nr:hypothetical protein [Gemmatimonadota bacterium]